MFVCVMVLSWATNAKETHASVESEEVRVRRILNRSLERIVPFSLKLMIAKGEYSSTQKCGVAETRTHSHDGIPQEGAKCIIDWKSGVKKECGRIPVRQVCMELQAVARREQKRR